MCATYAGVHDCDYLRGLSPANTHTYIHTYIQTYTHTYKHTHIHTYIHTYIPYFS